MYDSGFFIKGLRLSKSWRESVLQAVDDFCNPIENQFVATYFEHIYFKKSYSWSKPISVCGDKGLRIDRVFQCELVSEGPGIKQQVKNIVTMNICAKFKLHNDNQIYRAEYKLDRVKCSEKTHKSGQAPKRESWIHKDCQHRESYTRPILQICQGDTIEFSITLANLNGFVEWIDWEPATFQEAPSVTSLNYDKDWTKRLFFIHSS